MHTEGAALEFGPVGHIVLTSLVGSRGRRLTWRTEHSLQFLLHRHRVRTGNRVVPIGGVPVGRSRGAVTQDRDTAMPSWASAAQAAGMSREGLRRGITPNGTRVCVRSRGRRWNFCVEKFTGEERGRDRPPDLPRFWIPTQALPETAYVPSAELQSQPCVLQDAVKGSTPVRYKAYDTRVCICVTVFFSCGKVYR